jgi:hypothetical protein
MKIHRIVHGYVLQVYDSVTKAVISQEFVEGDPPEFEDECGNSIPEDGDDEFNESDYFAPVKID